MESYKKKVNLGNQEIILESGKVARQATGSVVATCGNTQILAKGISGRSPPPGLAVSNNQKMTNMHMVFY